MAKQRRRRPRAPESRGGRRRASAAPVIVKPRKLIPGIEGRSAWFVERSGKHERALSIERLKTAIAAAERMPDRAAIRDATFHEAQTLFSELGRAALVRLQRAPVLVLPTGRVRDVKVRRQSDKTLTMLSPAVETDAAGYLFIPARARESPAIDLEHLVVSDITDPDRLHLNPTFTYWPNEDLFVGRLWHAGVYQIHGWPMDPLLRAGLETLARYWPLINTSGDAPPEELSAHLGGLLRLHGLDARQVRALIGGGVRPPFVKDWWDILEIPPGWLPIGPVPAPGFNGIGRVTQIAIHPTNGNILIAGAAGGGVFKTLNGGVSWFPTMHLQPTLTIGGVAIAPSKPNIMYAASGEDGGDWNPAWGGVGLYRSNNGGLSWTLMSSVPSTRFSAIAVHPTKPDTVYLAGNRGLHKTTDGGLTWRTNPGQQSLFDGQITDVVVAFEEPVIGQFAAAAAAGIFPFPLFAETVYIGVASDGVYRSTVGGEQFGATPAFDRLDDPNQLPSGFNAGWIKLAIGRRGRHRSKFLAAKMGPSGSRIFTTVDGGDTWTERAQNVATVDYDEWCSLIAVDPADENILYAGAAGALMRTLNGGSSLGDWTSINQGVHADQQDMVFDPLNTRRLFLANDGGVYRSTNRGDTWTLASNFMQITQFYDIDVSEHHKQIAAGGSQDNGMYFRDQFGVWRNVSWGDGTQAAIDPSLQSVVYFSSQNGVPGSLRRTINLGGSHTALGQTGLSGDSPWVTIIKLEPRDPTTNPLNARVMFVCGDDVLFRSTDSGQHWQRVEDGGGQPFRTSGEISALEFAVSDPSILYLGTDTGALYRAVNGGQMAADWTRIDTPGSPADALFPFSRIQAIRVHARNANDVWLVFGGSGVSFTDRPDMILNPTGISHLFRNRNATDINGWADVSGAFAALSLPDVPTSAAALDDADPEVAYAGTDVGVFRTTDGGDTWGAFQDGLPRCPIVELRFNRRFRRLFAGTMGRGMFIRDV